MNNQLEAIGIRALKASKAVHDDLGREGAWLTKNPNKYDDRQLIVDGVAEKAIMRVLKESGRRWLILSEEHPPTETHPGEEPEGLAVIDGMDGSRATREHFLVKSGLIKNNDRINRRYGTMLALAPTPDPTYGEFVFGGIYEHAYQRNDTDSEEGRLIYATKGKGTFEEYEGEVRRVHTTETSANLGPNTPGYYLEYEYFGADGRRFVETTNGLLVPRAKLYSSASHIIDLVTDSPIPRYAISQPDREKRYGDDPHYTEESVVFIAETGRKGMEEWPTNFALGREAGVIFKTMINGKASNIEELPFRRWSQNWFDTPRPTPKPIIAGRSEKIVDQLLLAS